jgi:hypothetical protein
VTDDLRGEVVGPAVAESRDGPARRRNAVLAAVAAVSLLLFTGIATDVFLREADLQQQVMALSDSDTQNKLAAQQNHAAAQTLAQQVKNLGGTPVVSPPPGPAGATGPAGPAGRGITGTAVSAGHLYVTYTDGQTEDKGPVVGSPGVNGRGITGANATSGHLVLAYSDGSTSDAGAVVGPTGPAGATGRGIKSVTTANGELLVTYDDDTTADAGALPAGPPGPTGPQGVQGPSGSPPAGWTWTDELGRTYHCQRDPSSPDTAPTYTCPTASPTTTTTAAAARTRPTGR